MLRINAYLLSNLSQLPVIKQKKNSMSVVKCDIVQREQRRFDYFPAHRNGVYQFGPAYDNRISCNRRPLQ